MNRIIEFEVNIEPKAYVVRIPASQFEVGAILKPTFLIEDKEFEIPTDCKVMLRGSTGGNGKKERPLSFQKEISYDGASPIEFEIDELMSHHYGRAFCEFVFKTEEEEICTQNFYIDFEKCPFNEEQFISTEAFKEAIDIWVNEHIANIIEGGQSVIGQLSDKVDLQETRNENFKETIAKEVADFEVKINKAEAEHKEEVEKSQEEFTADITDKYTEMKESVDASNRKYQQTAQLAETAFNTANDASNVSNDALVKTNQNTLEVESLDTKVSGKVDGAYVENGYLYLTSDNEVVAGPLGPFSGTGGGSGGSGGNNAVLSVSNTAGWLSKTVGSETEVMLKFYWQSIEDEIPTGNGIATISVNGVVRGTVDVPQGEVSIKANKYLATGSNTLKLTVTDAYGNSRTINYRINVVNISITSTFDTSSPFEGSIVFPYTPMGDITKTVHFIVDGEEVGTQTVVASGRQQTFLISEQAYGGHTLKVYFDCEIDGQTAQSNVLTYSFIALGEGNAPIIISDFDKTEVSKYTNITIGYKVYVPSSLTAPVNLKVNGETISSITVNRNPQTWSYRANAEGNLVLQIESGETVKTFNIEVTPSSVMAEAETNDLEFYLNAEGRSNNEESPLTWKYENYEASFSGFNLITDGWQSDEDGNTVMRVAGGASINIPFKPFSANFNTTGKTIEVEFATRDVLNYDSVILSCLNGGRGLEITAQKATFNSEQSEISTQFKEDEHVRLSFVVEKRAENRLIYIYINGIMSGVIQYPTTDNFKQVTPAGITINSNGCTVDIYSIRVYNNNLTRYQILDNFIADTQNVDEMLERFNRNNIFDAYGNIVIDKLPRELPYIIFEGAETPQYKGDKKTMSGSYHDAVNPQKNFTFAGAQVDVQGTSSQYYARKNYKVKFKKGVILADGSEASAYALRADSMPVDTFTFKADVASSEGANNVELVRLYNDAIPYKTEAQKADSRVRQGIDGFPIVVFWNDGDKTTFLGKYNFNNDKGTENLFGFTEGDESWETLNNTSDLALFKSDDFSKWEDAFEGRYPDGNTDISNLKELATWLKSTDRTQATNQNGDTAEARLAKFKAEAEEHLVLEACEFYYLFTELFLMVDSRAKNSFPTFYGDKKWFSLPYDFDTAIGINNEGALAFSYNLEDTDKTAGGADVFNGQNSVLWTNLRDAFGDEIKAMYQTLRSQDKLSYEIIENAFEEHQSKWSEAIFNEDAWFKYLQPLVESNDSSYLTMLQGSKAEQRKWWLYNRFRYLDSKYSAGDAQSDVITLRGYAKDNVKVKPYADIYATVKFGSVLTQVRANRNQEYTLACPLDNVNDTEIYIYSASQLAELGDVSGLKVGYADFSHATKLQTLKIGDASSSYSNGNLTELYLGNNTLLKTIDVRNCPNLAMAVDLSGCTNLEEAYFDGTGLTGLQLVDGGKIKKLHLPATLANLTLKNQSQISEFVLPSYDNLTTVDIENAPSTINTLNLFKALKAGARVRMTGIDWNVGNGQTFLNLLDSYTGLDENGFDTPFPVLAGKIYFTGATNTLLKQLKEKLPYVTFTHDDILIQYTWYYDDGTVYKTQSFKAQTAVTAPSNPTKSTTGTDYSAITFKGWKLSKDGTLLTTTELNSYLTALSTTEDREFYAVFTYTLKSYKVSFYDYEGGTRLSQVTVPIHGNALEYYTGTPSRTGYNFLGWDKDVSNVTSTLTVYGKWEEIQIRIVEISDSWEQIVASCNDGTYKTKYSVGMFKPLDLGEYGVANMQIVAFNVDDLSDGSGKAPISWVSMSLINAQKLSNKNEKLNFKASFYEAENGVYKTQLLGTQPTATATMLAKATEDGYYQIAVEHETFTKSTVHMSTYLAGENSTRTYYYVDEALLPEESDKEGYEYKFSYVPKDSYKLYDFFLVIQPNEAGEARLNVISEKVGTTSTTYGTLRVYNYYKKNSASASTSNGITSYKLLLNPESPTLVGVSCYGSNSSGSYEEHKYVTIADCDYELIPRRTNDRYYLLKEEPLSIRHVNNYSSDKNKDLTVTFENPDKFVFDTTGTSNSIDITNTYEGSEADMFCEELAVTISSSINLKKFDFTFDYMGSNYSLNEFGIPITLSTSNQKKQLSRLVALPSYDNMYPVATAPYVQYFRTNVDKIKTNPQGTADIYPLAGYIYGWNNPAGVSSSDGSYRQITTTTRYYLAICFCT